jgi:glycosyltransferase involved in cell wall biosynthesis
MKLTVLLPIFNEIKFIQKTLESLQAQNYDFCAFISDNSSTDGTSELVRDVISSDNRFKYKRQEKNIGAYLSFVDLIKHLKSPYFMTLGGHDFISEDYFERTVSALDFDESLSMALGEPNAIDEDDNYLGSIRGAVYDFNKESRLERYLQSVKFMANCTCFHSIFRSRDAHGLKLKKTISADHVFVSHFLWKGNIAYIPEAKYFRRYFKNPRNSTQSERISGSDEFLSRHDFFCYYIESFRHLYGFDDGIRLYLENRILGILEARWGSQGLLPNDGLKSS